MNLFRALFGSFSASIQEINRKYSRPTIEMTPLVRVCLVSLRVYLFVLVGLLVYKFLVTVKG